MTRTRGFTLVELLVATAVVLLLGASLFAIVGPAASGARARAAAIDLQQRLRAASEMIGADLAAAGAGPVNGVFGGPLGAVTASVLPFRIGPRGEAPGTVRQDVLSILAAPGGAAAASLAEAWMPGGGPATVSALPGCPSAGAACGFRAGGAALVIDPRGHSDLYRVDAIDGTLLTLTPRGATSGRGFPPASLVVPVTVVDYELETGAPGEGGRLVSGDGDSPDMPVVDHVVALSFILLGEPRPPSLTDAPGPPRSDYGPSPPPLSEDDPRDAWGAGENCTFVATASGQTSRLALLHGGTRLVPLSPSMLADGPWCPDATAPGRYDADLLRVRAVRVSLRLEASASEARGTDSRWFTHPGRSRERSFAAADQQLVFDVVPRALQRGR